MIGVNLQIRDECKTLTAKAVCIRVCFFTLEVLQKEYFHASAVGKKDSVQLIHAWHFYGSRKAALMKSGWRWRALMIPDGI